MKKLILFLMILTLMALGGWYYTEKRDNTFLTANYPESNNSASYYGPTKTHKRVYSAQVEIQPAKMQTPARPIPIKQTAHAVNTPEPKDLPVPTDAVLETGETEGQGHHHIDFEAFLAARELRRQNIAQQLDKEMAKESQNLEWQQDITAKAEFALEQVANLKGAELSNISCSASICKLNLTTETDEALEQVTNLSKGIGTMLGGDSWTKPDKALHLVTVYLSQPGNKLPFTGD
jgi:hypothetical protein